MALLHHLVELTEVDCLLLDERLVRVRVRDLVRVGLVLGLGLGLGLGWGSGFVVSNRVRGGSAEGARLGELVE